MSIDVVEIETPGEVDVVEIALPGEVELVEVEVPGLPGDPGPAGPRGPAGVVVINQGEVTPPAGTPIGTIVYQRA